MNTSKAIDPPAQTVGIKAITYKITLSGLKSQINLYLLQVDFFLNFTSLESNFKSLGSLNIVTIFLLKTADCFKELIQNPPPKFCLF